MITATSYLNRLKAIELVRQSDLGQNMSMFDIYKGIGLSEVDKQHNDISRGLPSTSVTLVLQLCYLVGDTRFLESGYGNLGTNTAQPLNDKTESPCHYNWL